MKADVKQVAYMNINESGDWWVWNEFCNKCGKQIRDYSILSVSKPDESKENYCLDCMREMIDKMRT